MDASPRSRFAWLIFLLPRLLLDVSAASSQYSIVVVRRPRFSPLCVCVPEFIRRRARYIAPSQRVCKGERERASRGEADNIPQQRFLASLYERAV